MKKRIVFLDIVIFSAILCFLVFVMVISSPVSIWGGYRFYFYVIFSVLIPGIAVYRLLRIPQTNSMEEIVCGYGLGYGLVILQYFIFAFFQKLSFFTLGQILFNGSAFLYFLWSTITRAQTFAQKSDMKKDWCPLILLVLLTFGIRYVSYYGLNLLPSLGQDVIFRTQDILFYIGNAVSAKKGFPLEEFRFFGQTFKYHYFGSIFLGAASLFTGIDTLKLEVCLQWIQPIILVPFSFYVLMRRMKIQRRFCFLGLILLLFTAGAELLVYVAYQSIMYKAPFGFDLGLAMGILFMLYFYIQNSLEKFHWGIFSAALFTFFLCEGTKAPIAVVMLFLAGNICLLWLFSSGKRKWAVLYGIFLIIVFLAVFFVFVSNGMSTVTTNASGLRFDLTGHLFECGLGKLYFKWTGRGFPGWMGKLIILLLYFFGCNMAVYGIFPIFVHKAMFSYKCAFFSFEGCLLSAVVFGLVFTLFTKQTGNSQMYFAMTSFPIAILWVMKSWSQNQTDCRKIGFSKFKLFHCLFFFLVLTGLISFAQILKPVLLEGQEKLIGKSACEQISNSLTYAEAEAYKWVREETPENALCVTNVVLDDSQFESFVVGVCTERQLYMEGWRYVEGYLSKEVVEQRRNLIRDFFEGKREAIEELSNANVHYIIWVKRYGEKEETHCFGTKVFENSGVSIYDIT